MTTSLATTSTSVLVLVLTTLVTLNVLASVLANVLPKGSRAQRACVAIGPMIVSAISILKGIEPSQHMGQPGSTVQEIAPKEGA